MKLYAKVKSDRAEKAQGGNREIVIDLLIDPVKRKEVGRVVMRYGEKGEGEHEGYTIFYYPINENCQEQKINSGRVLLFQEKSEKQKGDEKCPSCGQVPDELGRCKCCNKDAF